VSNSGSIQTVFGVPRAVIPRAEGVLSHSIKDVLADITLISPRERRRNQRLARLRTRELEQYCSPEREADLVRERPALIRQKRNKKPGDPSRGVPLAFDEQGNFVERLVGRVPERQAKQALLLLEQGLSGKGRRQAWCGLIGRRRDCFSGHPEHRFYAQCFCGNRYCPTCGPRSFRDLFNRHSRLHSVVDELLEHRTEDHRPRILAKIDFTIRNTGEMPSASQVRQFSKDIRRFFRAVEKKFGISRRDYGFLWCCEFGSGNTNLHAHGVYAGPILPQRRKELSRLWADIRSDGSYIVSIKLARSFEAALGHALKYPSKYFEAAPARLVELEVAFDRVRRVHALARFYNPKIEREPGEEGPVDPGHCPLCGDLLIDEPGWHFIGDLKLEGRRDIELARIDAARARAFSESPP
jgi:hypothetical protein